MKPANYKEHRRDRRLARNQNGKRMVVIAARERNGKTITFVSKTEDASVPTLHDRIEAGSTVYADEASHWDAMHARYETKRINHSRAYCDGDGCTNQAESFFSRLRRAEIGTHHHIAGPYLASYAAEMDWREDRRRVAMASSTDAGDCCGAGSRQPPVEGVLAAARVLTKAMNILCHPTLSV